MDKWTFNEVDRTVDTFESVLRGHGVHVAHGSMLEHGCLVLKNLKTLQSQVARGERLPNWPTIRSDVRLALGILNVAQLIIDTQFHPDFAQIIPHLPLLNRGMPAQTAPSASANDDAGNKLFELRLALACMRTGTELELDHPQFPSGKNPDVLCRMRDARRWGFACKVIHGSNPLTMGERFLDGVEQIERSNAEVGTVVLSLKNLLPGEDALPTEGVDCDGDPKLVPVTAGPLLQHLADDVTASIRKMAMAMSASELQAHLYGKKAFPIVTVPVDTVAVVATPTGPVLSHLSFLDVVTLSAVSVPREVDGAAYAVMRDINAGLIRDRPLDTSFVHPPGGS